MEDAGVLPRYRVPLADLVGSERLGGVEATTTGRGGVSEAAIAASPHENLDAVQGLAQQGTVAEAAVADSEDQARVQSGRVGG